jgi:hypothetical protein
VGCAWRPAQSYRGNNMPAVGFRTICRERVRPGRWLPTVSVKRPSRYPLTGLKISGAVIPRSVFTQPGSKREAAVFPLMSACPSCGHSSPRRARPDTGHAAIAPPPQPVIEHATGCGRIVGPGDEKIPPQPSCQGSRGARQLRSSARPSYPPARGTHPSPVAKLRGVPRNE